MRLYLIRHGQTEANIRGALDTALPGPVLTDLGRRQADELAERLRGEPVVAVYASQATRARQTAAPLAAAMDLEVEVIGGVQEVSAGDLEGRTDREAVDAYMGLLRPWTRGDLAGRVPGGETGYEVRDRYFGAVAELRAKHGQVHPDGVVALVSHGGAIRLNAEWLADNVGADVADTGMLPNTSIVQLETADHGGWHCLRWAGLTP